MHHPAVNLVMGRNMHSMHCAYLSPLSKYLVSNKSLHFEQWHSAVLKIHAVQKCFFLQISGRARDCGRANVSNAAGCGKNRVTAKAAGCYTAPRCSGCRCRLSLQCSAVPRSSDPLIVQPDRPSALSLFHTPTQSKASLVAGR